MIFILFLSFLSSSSLLLFAKAPCQNHPCFFASVFFLLFSRLQFLLLSPSSRACVEPPFLGNIHKKTKIKEGKHTHATTAEIKGRGLAKKQQQQQNNNNTNSQSRKEKKKREKRTIWEHSFYPYAILSHQSLLSPPRNFIPIQIGLSIRPTEEGTEVPCQTAARKKNTHTHTTQHNKKKYKYALRLYYPYLFSRCSDTSIFLPGTLHPAFAFPLPPSPPPFPLRERRKQSKCKQMPNKKKYP